MLSMKYFILLSHGYEAPTPHRETAWNTWLQRRAASGADAGNPLGPGRGITNDTTDELSPASNPASGLSIVVAEHIGAAEQLLAGCPIVDSVALYEAVAPEGGHNASNTVIDRPLLTAVAQTKMEGNFR